MSSDFNKLDKVRETKLVTAILKAAALSKVSDKPEHLILALQLKISGFDHRFAKVATGAYNKRKTIDHMTSNPEQTRGGSFAIVDADAVADALGRVSKTASAATDKLVFNYTAAPAMQKTASADTKHTQLLPMRYMHDMTIELAQLHMSKCLNKLAALADTQIRLIRRITADRDSRMQKVAAQLEQHPNGYQALDAAVAATGPQLVLMLSLYIPDIPRIDKVAGYRAPDARLHALLVSAYNQAIATELELRDKQDTLELMGKVAGTIDKILEHFVLSILRDGVSKTASGLGSLVTTVPAAALMSGISTVLGTMDAAGSFMPMLLLVAGSTPKVDPRQYITPKFIVDERQLAHTMALSDMLADKLLAKQYGVYDISRAFNRLLQTSAEFLRPTRRLALRAQLRTMLAQGGKLSTADLAAARKMVLRLKDLLGMISSILGRAELNLLPSLGGSLSHISDMAKAMALALTGKDNSLSRKFIQLLLKKLALLKKKNKDDDNGGSGNNKGNGKGGKGKGQPPNLGGNNAPGNQGGNRGAGQGGNQGGNRGGQGNQKGPGQLGQQGPQGQPAPQGQQGQGAAVPNGQPTTNP